MKIGARNRVEGVVVEIKRGTVMCQVKVKIAGDAVTKSAAWLDSPRGEAGYFLSVAAMSLSIG